MTDRTPAQALWEGIFDAMPPMPSLKVSEWAEKYRFLSPERTNEHGKFRCDRIPMQREPMDSVCDERVAETVLWWASQTAGKTEVLFNIAGFFMHADPATILYVLPTVELCEEYSRDGLAPMIRDCPVLRKRVADPRSRDSGNTVMGKRYPGGSFVFAGANAPAGLAGRPRRVILKDEIDRYPLSAGAEGDPCSLADKRAESYDNAVKVSTSTATVKGLSKVENLYLQSDQRKWHVCCPKCSHEFVLMWAHVKWPEDDTSAGYIECPGNKCQLSDDERVQMVREGRWKATAPFRGTRGYWLNGLNILFKAQKGYKNRIHQFIEDFLKAKAGGRETMRTWINTFLAETYEEDAERIDANNVAERVEAYQPDELPEKILLLTAAADVQKSRIEVEVKGWGIDEECWGVEKKVFEGDTEKDTVWQEVDTFLLKTFTREDGVPLKIERAFIDMGYKDRRVLGFCAPRLNRGVYPCKGLNRPGLNPPPLLPAKVSRNNKARIPHWNVGVTVAKTAIYDRLLLPVGGPRSMHFPEDGRLGYTSGGGDYFRQLTAEKRQKKFQYGKPYFIFEKDNGSTRNEALDLTVYNLAAMASLAPIAWHTLAANMKKMASKAPKPAQEVERKPFVGDLKATEAPEATDTQDEEENEPEAKETPIVAQPVTPIPAAPQQPKPAPMIPVIGSRPRRGFGRGGGFVKRW